ncbi:MAG TPA: alpha-isopropylmalate synthase regulatory domain-containing protein, partial [Opitutaceae bacterium]|nr:alpha-isopropylmalate synthase regulatory domain-containing protein [Opitutaceae bacterium]
PAVKDVLEELKRLEFEGYEFEAADASLKLLLARWFRAHKAPFEFESFRVIIERRGPESSLVAEATVKVKVNGKSMHTVAECVGPVSALDKALRLALEKAHPAIKDTTLSDFKVRILDSKRGANSRTRVLIETTDGEEIWGTVGVSDNIIEASWEALCDAVDYKLLREQEKAKKAVLPAKAG